MLKILLSSVFTEAVKNTAEVTRFMSALHLITKHVQRIVIEFYA